MRPKILKIMLVDAYNASIILKLMLIHAYYSQNYAGIIYLSLPINLLRLHSGQLIKLICHDLYSIYTQQPN